MSNEHHEQTAGPVAARAATISPAAKTAQDDQTPVSGPASPGAAQDEAQAKQRPD